MHGVGIGGIRRILGVYSTKGGVGKSTVCMNLAVALARSGARVGLLDADFYGPSTAVMAGDASWPDSVPGAKAVYPLEAHGIRFLSPANLADGDTPVIWRGAMVHQTLEKLTTEVAWGELDYLLIDFPPGTGDTLMSAVQLMDLRGMVCVSTPQELALADTVRGLHALDQLSVPLLGLVENMSFFECDACGTRAELFGPSAGEMLADELGIPFWGQIPLDGHAARCSDEGEPVVLAEPDAPSAKALRAAADALHEWLRGDDPAPLEPLIWRDEPPAKMPAELDHDQLHALWQAGPETLGLRWADGREDRLSVRRLREACPCARCIDEDTGAPLLDPTKLPDDLTLVQVAWAGRYGLRPHFSDGHSDGIYALSRLRALGEEAQS